MSGCSTSPLDTIIELLLQSKINDFIFSIVEQMKKKANKKTG